MASLNETRKLIQKYRKQLKQVENLERLNRQRTPEEAKKVKNKTKFRGELQNLLSEVKKEDDKTLVEEEQNDSESKIVDEKENFHEKEHRNKINIFEEDPPESHDKLQSSHEASTQVQVDEQVTANSPPVSKKTIHTPQPNKEEKFKAKVQKEEHSLDKGGGDCVPKLEKKKKLQKPALALSSFTVTYLEGHNEWITAVAIHHNVIVTASQDTTVKTWDLLTGAELKNFGGHKNAVTCLEVLDVPEGDDRRTELFEKGEPLVISGSFDCTLRVWTLNSGHMVKSIYTYNPITKISYAPLLSLLVVGSDTGKIELWNLESKEQQYSLHAYDASVTGIKVTGQLLQSCDSDGVIKVHSFTDNKLACMFESENVKSVTGNVFTPRHIRSLEVCERGTLIGDDARNIKILNWKKNEVSKVPNHNSDYSSADAIKCRNNLILASSYDLDLGLGYLNVRRDGTLDYLATFDDKETERILCLDFCHLDNGNMVVVTGGSELKRWEILNKPGHHEGDEVYSAEFRRYLSKPAVDSEDEDDGDDDDDNERDSEEDESDESESTSEPRAAKCAQETSSWMSWCSVL